MYAHLRKGGVDAELAEVGVLLEAPDRLSIALSVTLRTPGGCPGRRSSRPSEPSSAHRFRTL